VALRRTIAEATGASYLAAVRLREAGNITQLELDRRRAEHEQAKLLLSEAEADAEQDREQLNALMGLWGPATRWRLAGGLPRLPVREIDGKGLESLAVRRRPELAAARREWEAQAQRIGVARAEAIFPDAQLTGHLEREPDGTITVGPSLTLPLPIFDQGQAASSAGQARLRQAAERYFARAVEIRSEVRAAYRRMVGARRRAEFQEKVVMPLRRAIIAESQLQYNAMQLNVFDLLGARREELEASLEHVASVRDYWLWRAQLQRAIGGRLPLPAASAVPGVENGVRRDPPGNQHHHE
jgi:cobalt-zinc-cadmium efflux system outer membrane protein